MVISLMCLYWVMSGMVMSVWVFPVGVISYNPPIDSITEAGNVSLHGKCFEFFKYVLFDIS